MEGLKMKEKSFVLYVRGDEELKKIYKEIKKIAIKEEKKVKDVIKEAFKRYVKSLEKGNEKKWCKYRI